MRCNPIGLAMGVLGKLIYYAVVETFSEWGDIRKVRQFTVHK